MTGIRLLRARSLSARVWSVARSLRYSPRLYLSPRSNASWIDRSITCRLALPCGSDPLIGVLSPLDDLLCRGQRGEARACGLS